MPLSSLDIQFYYTYQATGPANNTLSLGSTLSGYTIPDATANNIFDDVTGDEAQSGDKEYRGIGIYINTVNSAGSFDAIAPRIWIEGFYRAVTGADTIFFGATTFPLNQNTMQLISNEETAPSGIGWVEEGSPSATIFWDTTGSSVTTKPATEGTLKSENWVGIWFMRTVPPGASAWNNRSFTLTFQCQTTASPYRMLITKRWVVTWEDFNVLPLETIQEILQ